jgi:predicted ribosome quality control (RQC) complex YloA/Tae2 family protein
MDGNELLADFQSAKASLRAALQERQRRLQWSLQNIAKALAQCEQWHVLQHEALLLQAHRYRYDEGADSLPVDDWELCGETRQISLDKSLGLTGQIQARLLRAKKLKRGAAPLVERQKLIAKRLDVLLQSIEALEQIQDEQSLNLFKSKHSPKTQKKLPNERTLPYRTYRSASGLQIFVGKGAKGNGLVTFSVAAGNDLWCHVHGYPGSHVILKVPKGHEADAEAIHDALQLALFYSKASDGAEVVLTQAKYVRPLGPKDKGKVQLSKHALRLVKRDMMRIKTIQGRAHMLKNS